MYQAVKFRPICHARTQLRARTVGWEKHFSIISREFYLSSLASYNFREGRTKKKEMEKKFEKCTYVDNNSLAKIMIVRYWFKMSMASPKTVRRPPFFILTAQLG